MFLNVEQLVKSRLLLKWPDRLICWTRDYFQIEDVCYQTVSHVGHVYIFCYECEVLLGCTESLSGLQRMISRHSGLEGERWLADQSFS